MQIRLRRSRFSWMGKAPGRLQVIAECSGIEGRVVVTL
jgi:hypothetical protein